MRGAAFGAVLALAGAMAAGAFAAEPSMTVKNSVSAIAAAQAQALASQAKSYAQGAGPGTGPSLYLNPGQSAQSIPGFSGLSSADQNLAMAGSSVYELMKALGESSGNGTVLQRRDNMVYVGIDGEGGRWFANAEQAIGFMFAGLVRKTSKFHYGTQEAVFGCAQDILCAVLAVVADPYFTIATVARGGSATVTINGTGFSNSGGGPQVAADDGILVAAVTFVSSEQLSATLTVTPSAKLGTNFVAVFNSGQAFRNTGAYKLIVTDGKGEAPATQATSRAAALPLALPGAADGQIVTGGAEQYFRIDVAAAGTLKLSSAGAADLKGTLEDMNGVALATNDDGGTLYNFTLAQTVAPGTYYLRVGHCCAGTSAYRISASLGQ